MERDPGSDLPQDLGLLEHGYIETSRPKRERSSQTSDTAADDCNAKRTRHFVQTFVLNRNADRARVRAAAVIRLPFANTSNANWPGRPSRAGSSDASRTHRPHAARRNETVRMVPASSRCWSMHSTFQKEASNSKPWLLSATSLYYTFVKFNQEKNEHGHLDRTFGRGRIELPVIADQRGGKRLRPASFRNTAASH